MQKPIAVADAIARALYNDLCPVSGQNVVHAQRIVCATVLSVLFFVSPVLPFLSASMEFRSAPTPFGAVRLLQLHTIPSRLHLTNHSRMRIFRSAALQPLLQFRVEQFPHRASAVCSTRRGGCITPSCFIIPYFVSVPLVGGFFAPAGKPDG